MSYSLEMVGIVKCELKAAVREVVKPNVSEACNLDYSIADILQPSFVFNPSERHPHYWRIEPLVFQEDIPWRRIIHCELVRLIYLKKKR